MVLASCALPGVANMRCYLAFEAEEDTAEDALRLPSREQDRGYTVVAAEGAAPPLVKEVASGNQAPIGVLYAKTQADADQGQYFAYRQLYTPGLLKKEDVLEVFISFHAALADHKPQLFLKVETVPLLRDDGFAELEATLSPACDALSHLKPSRITGGTVYDMLCAGHAIYTCITRVTQNSLPSLRARLVPDKCIIKVADPAEVGLAAQAQPAAGRRASARAATAAARTAAAGNDSAVPSNQGRPGRRAPAPAAAGSSAMMQDVEQLIAQADGLLQQQAGGAAQANQENAGANNATDRVVEEALRTTTACAAATLRVLRTVEKGMNSSGHKRARADQQYPQLFKALRRQCRINPYSTKADILRMVLQVLGVADKKALFAELGAAEAGWLLNKLSSNFTANQRGTLVGFVHEATVQCYPEVFPPGGEGEGAYNKAAADALTLDPTDPECPLLLWRDNSDGGMFRAETFERVCIRVFKGWVLHKKNAWCNIGGVSLTLGELAVIEQEVLRTLQGQVLAYHQAAGAAVQAHGDLVEGYRANLERYKVEKVSEMRLPFTIVADADVPSEMDELLDA